MALARYEVIALTSHFGFRDLATRNYVKVTECRTWISAKCHAHEVKLKTPSQGVFLNYRAYKHFGFRDLVTLKLGQGHW